MKDKISLTVYHGCNRFRLKNSTQGSVHTIRIMFCPENKSQIFIVFSFDLKSEYYTYVIKRVLFISFIYSNYKMLINS